MTGNSPIDQVFVSVRMSIHTNSSSNNIFSSPSYKVAIYSVVETWIKGEKRFILQENEDISAYETSNGDPINEIATTTEKGAALIAMEIAKHNGWIYLDFIPMSMEYEDAMAQVFNV